MSQGFALEMAITPDWPRVDLVRESVAHCVAAVFDKPDLSDALSMVSSELLENALRYGGPEQDVITLTIRADASQLSVSVTNELDPSSEHAAALVKKLAWLGAFESPAEAYVATLQQVYARGPEAQESGLGLVRVAHEGGCRIVYEHLASGSVTVRAARSLGDPQEGRAA